MCWKSKVRECCREAALRDALSRPLSPWAAAALRLFEGCEGAPAGCGTQWRVGMAGATGLDYAGVAVVAAALGIHLPDVLAYVQVLELDQLSAWADDRKREEKVNKRG